MSPSSLWQELVAYLKLAKAYEMKLMLPDRDRAYVMAGCCASLMKFHTVSNYCRSQILQNNRGHMISKWIDFKTALNDESFQVFLKQVTRRLPFEKVESILQSLSYPATVDKQEYQSAESYLAAILEVDPDWLDENFEQ